MKKITSYQTKRLILKPTSKEDSAFVFALLNTPKWIEFIGDRNVKSVEAAEKYIADKMTPQYERLGYGNFTVIRKSDSAKIGSCGLYDREGLEGLDIGFAFLPEYEKQGYGFESAVKVRNLALNKFGINQISAITSKKNKGSQKLLEKIGLHFVKFLTLPDDSEELMFYQLKERK